MATPTSPAAAGAVDVRGCRDLQALQAVQKGSDLLDAIGPLRFRQVPCVSEFWQQAALFAQPVEALLRELLNRPFAALWTGRMHGVGDHPKPRTALAKAW